jgi:hypothetical protein
MPPPADCSSIGIPAEDRAGSKRADVLGRFLGFAVFAFGVWTIFDGFRLRASNSVIADLAPIQIGLGLLLAIAGIALVKRRVFALWILGIWLTFLIAINAYEIGSGLGFSWPLSLITMSFIVVFAYFCLHRERFKRIRAHTSEPRDSRTGSEAG